MGFWDDFWTGASETVEAGYGYGIQMRRDKKLREHKLEEIAQKDRNAIAQYRMQRADQLQDKEKKRKVSLSAIEMMDWSKNGGASAQRAAQSLIEMGQYGVAAQYVQQSFKDPGWAERTAEKLTTSWLNNPDSVPPEGVKVIDAYWGFYHPTGRGKADPKEKQMERALVQWRELKAGKRKMTHRHPGDLPVVDGDLVPIFLSWDLSVAKGTGEIETQGGSKMAELMAKELTKINTSYLNEKQRKAATDQLFNQVPGLWEDYGSQEQTNPPSWILKDFMPNYQEPGGLPNPNAGKPEKDNSKGSFWDIGSGSPKKSHSVFGKYSNEQQFKSSAEYNQILKAIGQSGADKREFINDMRKYYGGQ